LCDGGVDVLTERHGGREVSNECRDTTTVVDQTWLRNVFAGDGLIASCKDVVVTKDGQRLSIIRLV